MDDITPEQRETARRGFRRTITILTIALVLMVILVMCLGIVGML